MKKILFLSIISLLLSICCSISNPHLEKCESNDPESERDCYIALAYNEYGPLICEKMPEDTIDRQVNKAKCLAFMAYATIDVSLCRNQQNGYYKTTCEIGYNRYLFENIEEGQALKQKYKDMKEDPYPKKENNAGKTNNTNVRQANTPNPTTEKKDPSTCATIEDSYARDNCYKNIGQESLDPNLCSKINSSMNADECFMTIAGTKKDSVLCNEIKYRRDKLACFFGIGYETKNASICNMIDNESIKESCLVSTYGDPALCEGMKFTANKDICYQKTGSKLMDMSLCEKIQTSQWKDWCYLAIALKTQNNQICDKIQSNSSKSKCIDKISKGQKTAGTIGTE